jgi:hypothetical protein
MNNMMRSAIMAAVPLRGSAGATVTLTVEAPHAEPEVDAVTSPASRSRGP